MSEPGSPYRWAILAVCVAGFMQAHVHRVGFAPLIPTLVEHLGWRVGYALLAVPVLATMVAVWVLVRAEPRARDAGTVAGVPTQFLAGNAGGAHDAHALALQPLRALLLRRLLRSSPGCRRSS